MIGLNSRRAEPDGFFPRGGIVGGSQAIDKDAGVGLFRDVDDGGFEVRRVEGEHPGVQVFDELRGEADIPRFGHDGDSGIELLHFFAHAPGVGDHVVRHVVGIQVVHQIFCRDGFAVHIDADFAARIVEHFIEGGHSGAGEGDVLLDAGVEQADLFQSHFADFAGAIGGTADVTVVHQDEFAIGGGADVDFDVVGANAHGFDESRHGVLGMPEVFAPVRDHQNFFLLRECRN